MWNALRDVVIVSCDPLVCAVAEPDATLMPLGFPKAFAAIRQSPTAAARRHKPEVMPQLMAMTRSAVLQVCELLLGRAGRVAPRAPLQRRLPVCWIAGCQPAKRSVFARNETSNAWPTGGR